MIARRVKPILWAALATAALAASASATPLTPGTTQTPVLFDVIPVGSTLLADTGLSSFIGKNALNQINFTGNYEQWVYLDSLTHSLDFVTRVSNDATSMDGIGTVSLTDYHGYTTDVSWDLLHPGMVLPDKSARQSSGDTVGFIFDSTADGIAPGLTASDLIVKTNATSYTTGTINLIDGAVSTDPAFAPTTPEPGSLALLATGGLPLLGFLRRRVRTA
jgi:hypothetical protein